MNHCQFCGEVTGSQRFDSLENQLEYICRQCWKFIKKRLY